MVVRAAFGSIDLAAELGKEVAEIRQAVKELQGKP